MSKTILIVDDEPRITVAMMARLGSVGYTVYHAINGLAGVEAAAIHKPDLVVMDIRMPDINGYETCERIRRLPGMESVRVLFHSANMDAEAARLAKQAGGHAFLTKPSEPRAILAEVAHLIGTPDEQEIGHV